MNKSLKNLICASVMMVGFFSFYANSSNFTEKNENLVNCNLDSSGYHECQMRYHGKSETFKVKYDICPAFDISIDHDIVEVLCSPIRDYSNYSYYKYINGELLFFKYDSIFGGNDNLVDELSYETSSPYLLTLKRDFYNDMKNNNLPKSGFIKSKTFLFDNHGNKTKIYLVKNDKVLILSSKLDNANKLWLRIFYEGSKNIDMWVEESLVYIN
ncbi:hypothetical protein [Rodentibacter genomosp. 2]|uniref:hypothetical protein n=1 Tax=Rodentibacter genomosp. 2 TaxID=1908266 RepID=UPI00117AD189